MLQNMETLSIRIEIVKPRPNVLFLASWFPSRTNPVNGIFVRKHAIAVSKFCDVTTLFVAPDTGLTDSEFELEYDDANGIRSVNVYYRVDDLGVSAVSKVLKFERHVTGYCVGYDFLLRKIGEPDLVIVNSAYPAGLFALQLRKRGLKYIVVEHSSAYLKEDGSYENSPIYKKLLIRQVFKNATAVGTVSNCLLTAIRRHGLANGNCFVVPNVVGIPDKVVHHHKNVERIGILTVSALDDRSKNISGLIEAFTELVHKHGNIELHIVGDGEDKERLESLAEKTGLLGSKIFFYGYVPNERLHEYFAKAHFFVLNSNFETFSIATLEAMAHGVPVVVTECGGPQEFVTETTGVTVKRRNKESLLKGLEHMLANWQRYDPFELQRYVKERFSCDTIGKSIFKICTKYIESEDGVTRRWTHESG